MADLKPCPFCGGGFRVNCRGVYEHDNENCFLHGKELKNAKDVEEWNTRKPEETVVAKLEKEMDDSSGVYYCGERNAYEKAISIVRGKE